MKFNSITRSNILIIVCWTISVLMLYLILRYVIINELNKLEGQEILSIKFNVEREINNDLKKLNLFLDLNQSLLATQNEKLLDSRLVEFNSTGEFKYLKNIKIKVSKYIEPHLHYEDNESYIITNSSKIAGLNIVIHLDKLRLNKEISTLIELSGACLINNKELISGGDHNIEFVYLFESLKTGSFVVRTKSSLYTSLYLLYYNYIVSLSYIVGLFLIFAYKMLILKRSMVDSKSEITELKFFNIKAYKQINDLENQIILLTKSKSEKQIDGIFYRHFMQLSEKIYFLAKALSKENLGGKVSYLLTDEKREKIIMNLKQDAFLLANKIIFEQMPSEYLWGDVVSVVQDYLFALLLKRDVTLECSGDCNVRTMIGKHALTQIIISLIVFQLRFLTSGRKLNVELKNNGTALAVEFRDNGFGLDFEEMVKYKKVQSQDTNSFILDWTQIEESVKEHGLRIEYHSMGEDGGCFILFIPTIQDCRNEVADSNVIHLLKKNELKI